MIGPKVETHILGESRKENGMSSFRILRDALFLSLLRMPMAWVSLVEAWFICFDHSKLSSKKTPRYFTVSVCINIFPSRIILN